MWRSAGVTAVPHSTEVQGARPVARARGGGGVGHDNDIDDDDGELTFLLLYTVVLLPMLCTIGQNFGFHSKSQAFLKLIL